MNNAKHTPGPWVVDDEVSADEAGQETLGVYAEQGGYIAGIHCGPDTTIDEQDKANAHLIAAAPAMYEALQHAAMSYHHPACKCKGEYSANPERYCTCHVQKAWAALAQAEGR